MICPITGFRMFLDKERDKKGNILRERYRINVLNYYKVNEYGRVNRARYLMEQSIGRRLTNKEVVHHINGNSKDDKIENLQLLSRKEHMKIHKFGYEHKGVRTLNYDKIRELWESGLKQSQISKNMNLNYGSLKQIIRKHWKEWDRPYTPRLSKKLDYAKIRELWESGIGYYKISKILNYQACSVYMAIKRHSFKESWKNPQ
jgi:hypothetical protein